MYQELREFGLSNNEIEVFIALIKTGVTSANRISKITGLKRSTTYDNLDLLINRGLVSRILKDRTHLYEAASPQKIISLLDDRKEKILKIIPELESLHEGAIEKTGITFFEGKKGVITILNDILDEGKELWFYGSRKMAVIAQQNYPEDYTLKRAARGIQLTAVLALEDKGEPVYKDKLVHKLSKLRFSKELDNIPANVFIYSDRVAFMSSGVNLVGVIIKNKEIVAQQRKIFQIIWRQAKK